MIKENLSLENQKAENHKHYTEISDNVFWSIEDNKDKIIVFKGEWEVVFKCKIGIVEFEETRCHSEKYKKIPNDIFYRIKKKAQSAYKEVRKMKGYK